MTSRSHHHHQSHHNCPSSYTHHGSHKQIHSRTNKDEWMPECKTCGIKLDSPSSLYRHLTSNLHTWKSLSRDGGGPPAKFGNMFLQLPEFLMWDKSRNERAIVVTDLECATNCNRLLLHFVKFGLVSDYIADPEGNFAIIQYHHKSCIRYILENYNSRTQIDGGNVRARCKECVSFIEWTILLDLDGVYEKRDQPFFIYHCHLMAASSSERIRHQLENFLEELSHRSTGSKRIIRKYLTHLFLPIFPDMCIHLIQPHVEDGILEIFMDPLGESRNYRNSSTLPENLPPYHHTPNYQAAIGRIRHVLGRLPVKESERQRLYEEMASVPPDEEFSPNSLFCDALLFHHYESGTTCRIIFDDPIAPFVGSLLELVCHIEPSLDSVIRFVHYWARVHRLSGINLVLSMMILVYFMKRGILPSVQALQKLAKYTDNDDEETATRPQSSRYKYVQGWKIEVCNDLPTIVDYLGRRQANSGEEDDRKSEEDSNWEEEMIGSVDTRKIFTHLKNFFGSYSWVDFGAYIISPHSGELVGKSDAAAFRNPKKRRNFSQPAFRTAPLIVQHPFDLRRNLAAVLDEAFVNRMQIEFRNTYQRMEAVLRSSKPKLEEMFPDFQSLLRWEPHPHPPRAGIVKKIVPSTFLSSTTFSSKLSSSSSESDSELECETLKDSGGGDHIHGGGKNGKKSFIKFR